LAVSIASIKKLQVRRYLTSWMANENFRKGGCAHPDLATLLKRVNSLLRGWCQYFKHGCSSATFGYLNHYTWWRVARWIRKRHARLSWRELQRKVFLDGYRIVADGIELFNPATVATVHDRWRGYRIPTPWSQSTSSPAA